MKQVRRANSDMNAVKLVAVVVMMTVVPVVVSAIEQSLRDAKKQEAIGPPIAYVK